MSEINYTDYKEVYKEFSSVLIDKANEKILKYTKEVKQKLNSELDELKEIILLAANNELYVTQNNNKFDYFKPSFEYFALTANVNKLFVLEKECYGIARFVTYTNYNKDYYYTKNAFLKEINAAINYYIEYIDRHRSTIKNEEYFFGLSYESRKKHYTKLARYEYKVEKLMKLEEEIKNDKK